MLIAQKILVGIVAIQHLFFCYLEMFCWDKPLGQKIFKTTPEFALQSKALAANQGLYNLFLAGGLIFALISSNVQVSYSLSLYFLACVIIAGIYGAWTVSPNIFFIQSIPAIVALILTIITR